jgi:hypothetical protein
MAQMTQKTGPFLVFARFFTSTCALPFAIGCIGTSENTEKNRVFKSYGETKIVFGRMARIW